MSKNKIMEKLTSLFKEESWGRMEPKDIGISRFKILDDILNSIISENVTDEALAQCKIHLEEQPASITAAYISGLLGYQLEKIDEKKHLRKLIEKFTENHKWAVVELLSEKILEYGESSFAFRALATSLERLGRSKEAIPVWDNLLKIDRFDAQVAKKLALAIVNQDQEKSIQYMKLSIEGFIKSRNFDEITPLWQKLVVVSWKDIQFFERIERMLVDAKQQDLAADLLKILLHKYRDDENPDRSIELLKKILLYRPDDLHSRRELVKLYETKYGEHSQFSQFLKLSKLNNFKAPVRFAIQDFEKNIVFDKGNFVYHNSWGLGKIEDIDGESIRVDFRDKLGHMMSIQMALQSLKPIARDHIYVMKYEDPEGLKALFSEDFLEFFGILIRSYGGEIDNTTIKDELVPFFVEEKNWSKWWSRARTQVKKDPLYGVSDKRKNVIYLRDKPVTFADELLGKFTATSSFSEKLDVAIEFINNIDMKEGGSVAPYLVDYFSEQIKGDSNTRQILSYFILTDLSKYSESSKVKLDQGKEKVIEYIKTSNELPILSIKIGSYDYKKHFVNLIVEHREDWPSVLFELLFETPVRIHKYIINILLRAHEYKTINLFIDRVIPGAKQYPDIFIWIAKNIFTGTWKYDWLDYPEENLVLTYFRLMNELKKIEVEGNRLKNTMFDILFDDNSDVLKKMVNRFDRTVVEKVFDMFENLSYVEDSQLEKFEEIVKSRFENIQEHHAHVEDEWKIDIEKLIVTKEGHERKKAELEHMVNVEMVSLTKELSAVSEASGDIRENVDYNALMEKQTVLKLAISRLDDEMKRADVLDLSKVSTESVNIGTRVNLEDADSGKASSYTILGPWDADFEQGILSYRSPIAKAMMGKKNGENVSLKIDDEERKFKIV
ncbi:MAG TPA: transcription elongation factor GreA, partial [Spirochaetota bacterium]|nr:transcription elongation factor GreA [Spirochaetota bacterium]